jgi:hypothetical protein
LLKARIYGLFNGEEKDMLYVFKANILKAFVMSNANISPRILIKVSLIIYGVYLVLYIAYAIRVLRLAAGRVNGSALNNLDMMRKMLLLGFVVCAGLAINAFVTGSMIFPHPRYVCYSMGLFYLSLISLVVARK